MARGPRLPPRASPAKQRPPGRAILRRPPHPSGARWSGPIGPARKLSSLVDPLIWSSGWVAAAAAALAAAASHALEVPASPAVLGLAFAGTVVVYTVDRLRDLPRDRHTAPERSAFVERYRPALQVQAGVAAGAALACGIAAGPPALAMAAVVAGLGFFHRRLKRFAWAKPVYLTLAWSAVTVGLPAAHAGAGRHLGWVLGIVAATLQANVALSNLRDGEGLAARLGTRRTLGTASAFVVAGIVLGLAGPEAVRPLLALPFAMAAAVAFFRPTERYGALVVDGALLIGGVAAWLA